MTDYIKIRPAAGKWVVLAGGAVLGESTEALELCQGELPPVIYFPRSDIAMAFLDPSDTKTTCRHKGEASYFHIEAKSGRIEDAVWTYENPIEGVEQITDYLAFFPERVKVEQL